MARAASKTPKAAAKKSVQALAPAIAAAPRLGDRKASQDRLTEWLSDIDRSAAGKSIKQLIDQAPKTEALLLGLADGSPYLWDLATTEPDRLLAVLNADPGEHLAALLAKSSKAVATA